MPREITVSARIDAVESSVQKHMVMRDYESEKQVEQKLRNELKETGVYETMKASEFQSLYQKKLRSYADYIDARFVEKDGEDGKPGLLVSKLMWENELRITYLVDKKSYTQTVCLCTREKSLKAGDTIYVTVDQDQPETILRKSLYDTRSVQPPNSSDDLGCGGRLVVVLVVAVILYYFFGHGMG